MKQTWIVFWKEFIDNLRDLRSLYGALFGAMLGPGLILLLIVILGQVFFEGANEATIEVPVQGRENGTAFIQFLEQNGAVIVDAPEDPLAAVRNGDVDLVLVIPEDFEEVFASGSPSPVQMIADSSRQSALVTVERTRALIQEYSFTTGAMRLMARGIDPVVMFAVTMQNVDVATPQSQVLIFLNMLPYFLMFTIFSGGAGVIIDATAGERERTSLEPLLINPVKRSYLVLGKLFASLPFGAGMVLITLLAFAVIFNLVPLEQFIGFRLSIDVVALIGIFLICMPILLLASALQMIIATYARNFKEAQTYVGYLPLVPALPGLGLAFLNVKAELWAMLIPTFGQQILINQFMRGEDVNWMFVAVSAGVTIVLALVLCIIAVRMYDRESIIFRA